MHPIRVIPDPNAPLAKAPLTTDPNAHVGRCCSDDVVVMARRWWLTEGGDDIELVTWLRWPRCGGNGFAEIWPEMVAGRRKRRRIFMERREDVYHLGL
ncbi:hypothetical protein Tco_0972403 [Tanacetum coccineum]